VGEPLHLLGGEALAVEHDRDRVATVGSGGEDVDLGEGAQHGQSMPGVDCCSATLGIIGFTETTVAVATTCWHAIIRPTPAAGA
jgi:hypothetical protein